jgi:phosphoglucomutase
VTWDAEKGTTSGKHILHSMRDKYVERLCKFAEPPGADSQRFIYTPLHGVGNFFMTKMMKRSGTTQCMTIVREQADPDPNFPTVNSRL